VPQHTCWEFHQFRCSQALITDRVNLRTEVGSSSTRSGEVTGKDWLDERAEDKLRTSKLWESEPEYEDELEGIVEWKPVDGADQALKNGQESKDNPVSEPLCIISFANTEKGLQRIVSWNHEAGEIGQELTPDVKEDEEKVQPDETEKGINLGDRSLLLEVVQDRVLRKLFINIRNVGLRLILD